MLTIQRKLFRDPEVQVSENSDGETVTYCKPKITQQTYYTPAGLIREIIITQEIIKRKLIGR